MHGFLKSRGREQQTPPSVIFNEIENLLEQERGLIEEEQMRLREKLLPHLGEIASREDDTFEFIVLEARNAQLSRVSLGLRQIRDSHIINAEQ
jgi:hypothetical protein